MNKEKITKILSNGDFQEMASLWKGGDMDKYYKQYEIEGYSHPQQWDDGTWHTYDGCYSLNDGNISDKMRKALDAYRNTICNDSNIWVYTNSFGREQAFVIYHNGTNGKEGNALNSMRDAANVLEKVQGFTAWGTLVSTYCDIYDDVYSWLLTFEVKD